MTDLMLLKGFEVELFTGTFAGTNVGVASSVTKDLLDFVKEPDQRNIEYITVPDKRYAVLKHALLLPRQKLRKWLDLKKLTILPGSTLSLGNTKIFERSDSKNLYHSFIEKNYGTKVVTASIHINLGIENLSLLFSALRLVRCEASLFLALSASSPFLEGKATGVHSQRWVQFPKTPSNVPMFLDHAHYVTWIEEQLSQGKMLNERHLWTSVRPNGPERPHLLNRLELRICDLVCNVDLLLAITALLELRIINLKNNLKKYDPIEASSKSSTELAFLSDENDLNAAKFSLDADLSHWRDGKQIKCIDWIKEILLDVTPLAKELDIFELLKPIESVLTNGNQSMIWLDSYSKGASIQSLLHKGINDMEREEANFIQMKSPT
ncbi:glutamate--cysteine ligase [Prochlorococcus marinus]|uniref:Putative glutamate--cysteine ligase n=1 Tax=Prochlorococcus marinus XMU1408 TaxID=2213228 RepID=A0A318R237_PROMR|nr:glutamate--cysteine ligase [Prochlorococcus marinus]MBW3042797.1 putative glutamate--cysteine ligase [Prochlorococcus marinus str. XMU1408]PYE00624.1 putative glutamate--cysteine ligase [Prochlorococcus marinus XMU1408]